MAIMFRSKILLITLLTIQNLSSQRLVVLSPDSLSDAFGKSGKIEYVTAHFGKVPYGSGIVGFLHTVDTKNQDGCGEMPAIESFDHYDDQPMILLRRGGCEFGTKAINAQNAGAKMVLVADDKDQELSYYPVAVDQRAQSVDIPVVAIGKLDGDKLFKTLTSGTSDEKKGLVLEFEVPIPERDSVKLELIMSAADTNAYEFILNFKNIVKYGLGRNFEFDVQFYTNTLAAWIPSEIDAESCLDDTKKLCLLTDDHPRTYLKIQNYQACAKQVMPALEFLDFMDNYYQSCGKLDMSNETEVVKVWTCLDQSAKSFGKNNHAAIETCLDEQKSNGNVLLTEMAAQVAKKNIYSHPTLVVNGRTIFGTLNGENAFNAVCEAFIDPPANCSFVQNRYVFNEKINDLLKNHQKNEFDLVYVNILLIVVIFTAAGVCFYYIFKKLYKNIIRTQLDKMVKDSIASYRQMPNIDSEAEPNA